MTMDVSETLKRVREVTQATLASGVSRQNVSAGKWSSINENAPDMDAFVRRMSEALGQFGSHTGERITVRGQSLFS